MVLAVLIHYSHAGKVVPLYWQIFVDIGGGVGAADSASAEATDADVGEGDGGDESESSTAAATDNFGDAASRLDTGSVVSFGSQSTGVSAATTGASTAAGQISRSSANRIPRRCPLMSLARHVDAEWQLARATQAISIGGQQQQQQQTESDDLRRLAADSMPDFCRGVCPLRSSSLDFDAADRRSRRQPGCRLPRQLEAGSAVWLAAASLCLTLVCSPEENLSLASACLLSLARRLHGLTRFLLQPMQLLYRAETVRLAVAGALVAGGIGLPFCTARAAKSRDRLTELGAKACKF